jgi:hypothetical protein
VILICENHGYLLVFNVDVVARRLILRKGTSHCNTPRDISSHLSSRSKHCRTELGDEMKRGMKEKDADIRILINEKGSLKDRLQKMEVSPLRALTHVRFSCHVI